MQSASMTKDSSNIAVCCTCAGSTVEITASSEDMTWNDLLF